MLQFAMKLKKPISGPFGGSFFPYKPRNKNFVEVIYPILIELSRCSNFEKKF